LTNRAIFDEKLHQFCAKSCNFEYFGGYLLPIDCLFFKQTLAVLVTRSGGSLRNSDENGKKFNQLRHFLLTNARISSRTYLVSEELQTDIPVDFSATDHR